MKPALSAIPSPTPSEVFQDVGFATVAEYCHELQVSRPTLDRLIREGLPHVDAGTRRKRCLRIPRAAAMAWLRGRSGNGR